MAVQFTGGTASDDTPGFEEAPSGYTNKIGQAPHFSTATPKAQDMQFCDECGSMMHTMGSKMVCSNDDCKHTVAKDEDLAAEYVSTEEQGDTEIIETEEGAEFEGKPTAKDVICDKCGHDEAWYTIKQTGAADEPPTRFFKCKECGYRWRGYN